MHTRKECGNELVEKCAEKYPQKWNELLLSMFF